MPRPLVVGNGRLLVNFDDNLNIRDIYYPHVSQENHVLGHMSSLQCPGTNPPINTDKNE